MGLGLGLDVGVKCFALWRVEPSLTSRLSPRYINALEAPSASFAKGFDRVMVRGEKAFHDELTEKHGKRKSNSMHPIIPGA